MLGAALLIGNATYRHPFGMLSTPRTDVDVLYDRFTELGFDSYIVEDAGRDTMARLIHQFGKRVERLPPNSNVVVYFGGHGLQHAGENYLVPLDASGADRDEIRWSCIRLSEIMDAVCVRDDQQKLIVLDMCRSNDLPSSTRGSAADLAGDSRRPYAMVSETIVLYATYAGHVALDGADKGSSPVCRGLLKALQRPHRWIKELTTDVIAYVSIDTHKAQRPWETGTVGDIRPFVPAVQCETVLKPVSRPQVDGEGWDAYVAARKHLVRQLTGTDSEKKRAVYFVFVEREREAEFYAATDSRFDGVVDVSDYGEVLASNYGELPNERTLQILKSRFGFVPEA